MTNLQLDLPNSQKPLRLWPGVVAVAVLWLARFGVPLVAPEIMAYSVLYGATLGVLFFIVWWAFFSRAPLFDRWGGLILMIIALFATSPILHPSIATGMMGIMYPIYAIPVLTLAFLAWAIASRRLTPLLRRVTMVATILLACGAWALVRTDGITGDGKAAFAWRWSATHEERLLAQSVDQPVPAVAETPAEQRVVKPDDKSEAQPGDKSDNPATPSPSPKVVGKDRLAAGSAASEAKPAATENSPVAAERQADWPGFRGAQRDSRVSGVMINTDWAASPPVELWRRPVGPGWSSFAVRSGLCYTQEQLGNNEVVTCYNLTTGKPVWRHRDSARFWESNGGPGPRATPTLSRDRVYTFGATGILNALDAVSGAVKWSRNVAADSGTKVPTWGFASSPLVVGDSVIVAPFGKLVAYDIGTGKPRWSGPAGGGGYSSPQLATIGGVSQILLLNGEGAIGVSLADGALLWEYKWPGDGIVQPALTTDGDVLIGTGSGMGSSPGIRCLSIAHGAGGQGAQGVWTVEERWTSIGLKPYYNDFVVHKGHAFGFDGSILACVDLKDGKRSWKGGRYGHGQLVLLPDQDLLLVLSEEGEVALVKAIPGQFTELARFHVLEGKTWNHPVLVGDLLLTRNGEQMAAFRLPVMGRP